MGEYFDPSDYKIGWICALPLEFTAATAILDDSHPDLARDDSDNNAYKFGRVGNCNIIIAGLPSGVYGTTSAAVVTSNLRRSFPSVTACLVVGIGGGAPLLPRNDIRLGDVVVSHPTPGFGGVLQYDYGKTIQTGLFQQTGVLNKPPDIFLTAITKLKSGYPPLGNKSLGDVVSKVLSSGSISTTFSHPSFESDGDRLFKESYDHPSDNSSCAHCDPEMVVNRPCRPSNEPYIHYGLIASANQVMKHGATRDRLSRESNILCFEMEAAGVMDQIPSLIIRGICDYSDSHKNKTWQHYAALVAAVYAKELLLQLGPPPGPPPPAASKKRRADHLDGVDTKDIFDCLEVLGATNPADDKARIEQSKDKLIKESYFWILSDSGFQQWLSGSDRPILRISGDPGKGKTMIMIGMIDHLAENFALVPHTSMAISYFFCQAADGRLNSAIAVLKGLISQLISNSRHSDLVRYLKREIDIRGKNCFNGPNTFYALERIFLEICRDTRYDGFCFMIDALDECTTDLDKLLNLICSTSTGTQRVRWLVTSRNRPDIESHFECAGSQLQISLELNDDHIGSTVNTYINSKIVELNIKKRYSQKVREEVATILREKAAGTFLWVHLACKELERVYSYNAVETLKNLPSGLNAFYKGMLEHLHNIYPEHDVALCSQILSAAVVTLRPLHLREMVIVAGLPAEMEEFDIEVQVKQCGSFLAVQNQTIFFVHQSAKDFLDKQVRSSLVIPYGLDFQHREVTHRCLRSLSEELRMNICHLEHPGFSAKDLTVEQKAPVLHLRYACYHWVDHLFLTDEPMSEADAVLDFLEGHLLHWLELITLLDPNFEAVSLVKHLELQMMHTPNESLKDLLSDLKRFSQYHQATISEAPLQLYSSAIIFSPENSVVKSFSTEVVPNWIKRTSGCPSDWGSVVQVLEGRDRADTVQIIFSDDDKLIAISSTDSNIRIWDIYSGKMIQSLITPIMINTVLFSPDSKFIAASSYPPNPSVGIWDIASGRNIGTWNTVNKPGVIAWIPGNTPSLVCAFTTGDMRLFHATVGKGPEPFIRKNNRRPRQSANIDEWPVVCITCDVYGTGNRLATGSLGTNFQSIIQLWDVRTRTLMRQLTGNPILLPSKTTKYIHSMRFTSDGRSLLFGSSKGVQEWDLSSDSPVQKLNLTSRNTQSTQFLSGGAKFANILAHGKGTYEIDVYEVSSGSQLRQAITSSLPWTLSSNGTQFVANHPQIRLCDVTPLGQIQPFSETSGAHSCMKVSPNGECLAAARETFIYLWKHGTPDWPEALDGHEDDKDEDEDEDPAANISCLEFSPTSDWLASCSRKAIRLWDIQSGALLWTSMEEYDKGSPIAFSADGKLASASNCGMVNIRVFDSEGVPVPDQNPIIFCATVENLEETPNTNLIFSPDGSLLASVATGEGKYFVNLWDIASGRQLLPQDQLKAAIAPSGRFHGPSSVSFSPDGKILVFAFRYITPAVAIIWDLASQTMARKFFWDGDIESLSFTEDSQFLRINKKIVDIDTMDLVLEIGNWLSYRGKRLLYFPPDEKPANIDLYQDLIFIGTSSGRLLVVEVPWLYPEEPTLEDTDMDDGESQVSRWFAAGDPVERLE
ncbi:hypothetical protein TWF281_010479 [Arthrobotrys megalospora]